MYRSEKEMYPDVALWLETYLKHKYPRGKVGTYDTSRENLSEFIRRHRLGRYFPEADTYIVKVDITGVIQLDKTCLLAFVECKIKPINLRDVSQLIGYSKVVQPVFSIIISPQGVGSIVDRLINLYRRYDVLAYKDNHKLRIARWNSSTKDIDTATLLPHGEHL